MTFEFSLEDRKALAAHLGEKRPVSRETVQSWIKMAVDSTLADITAEYQKDLDDEEIKKSEPKGE